MSCSARLPYSCHIWSISVGFLEFSWNSQEKYPSHLFSTTPTTLYLPSAQSVLLSPLRQWSSHVLLLNAWHIIFEAGTRSILFIECSSYYFALWSEVLIKASIYGDICPKLYTFISTKSTHQAGWLHPLSTHLPVIAILSMLHRKSLPNLKGLAVYLHPFIWSWRSSCSILFLRKGKSFLVSKSMFVSKQQRFSKISLCVTIFYEVLSMLRYWRSHSHSLALVNFYQWTCILRTFGCVEKVAIVQGAFCPTSVLPQPEYFPQVQNDWF